MGRQTSGQANKWTKNQIGTSASQWRQGSDLQQVLDDRCSSTAAAMAAPSEVAVPLPSSSRATRLAGVALFRAAAVSASSTKKVDWPDMTSSLAPMRTKTASTGVRLREWAGTQAPIWAITAARHTCGQGDKHVHMCSQPCVSGKALKPAAYWFPKHSIAQWRMEAKLEDCIIMMECDCLHTGPMLKRPCGFARMGFMSLSTCVRSTWTVFVFRGSHCDAQVHRLILSSPQTFGAVKHTGESTLSAFLAHHVCTFTTRALMPHSPSCHRVKALEGEFTAQVDCSSSGGVEVLWRDKLIHKCRKSG